MNNENNVVFDQNNSFEIESNNPNVTITRRTITPNQSVSQNNQVFEKRETQSVMIERLDPNEFPIITNYCEDLTAKEYVTNPAIAREDEIKKTMLVLLTPDKSALSARRGTNRHTRLSISAQWQTRWPSPTPTLPSAC